jgi:hypothetical protein
MRLDRSVYRQHLDALRHDARKVADCLPYEDMLEVPEDFDDWTATDFERSSHSRPELQWDDLCPVYALALATHRAYWPAIDDLAAIELEAQWDELRGVSSLAWSDAFPVLINAWNALDRLEPSTSAHS